ncbi:DUF5686 and carboxypeptidase-like regulatory domain-containing protein [Paludibacter propionicigenes]|nr:DUF5686 and carboxypeptidase-like regulatory domain-containing protein [Paludibacter propionicigenes]
MENNKLPLKINMFWLLLIIGLLVTTFTHAQETVVAGQVLNISDKNPISNVNIRFRNSTKYVQTNDEGFFLIRYTGRESKLIFSCVGYKTQEIKVRPGQSVGVQIEMMEENTLLQEALIIPGVNPANDLMRRVRLMRRINDISQLEGYSARSTEQNLVLLSKINQGSISKRIFEQLKTGNLSKNDSSLVIPLYMAESKYELTVSGKKQVSQNIFSSPESGKMLLEKLVGQMSTELNFYENTVTIFGKSIISPLAGIGNSYYNYYLVDSLNTPTGKQYEIHFKSRNPKNLAFNGRFRIDSLTYALTEIDAELPNKANINFIHNLRISAKYIAQPNHRWSCDTEDMALNMNYELLADDAHPRPEVFIKRTSKYSISNTELFHAQNFAKSDYDQITLNSKLDDLNNTPLLRTAKLIANVALTGNIPMGKVDLGNILQLARLTNIEGTRLTLPLKTNEKLWPNVAIGGYLGYGTKNNTFKYSAMAGYKLPGKKKRVINLSYTDDYRRIDYNYNNFLYHENPLVTGDEDISTTLLMLWSGDKLNPRKELNLSFFNDWNSDIESALYLRANKLYANSKLPMQTNGVDIPSLQQRSATFNTRFSFGERTYENHLQRIYIQNNKPVLSLTFEGGQYSVGDKTGGYGKLMSAVKQYIHFDYGEIYYVAEAGYIVGKVPYPLLEIPMGSEAGGYGIFRMNIPVQTGSGGYSMYQYNMMRYMEYAADKYVNLQTEFAFNGLLMNQIPLIKHLNLRELLSFKLAYGSLSDSHRAVLDYPVFMQPIKKPYMEVGVGFTNIFHLLSVQSVWRLTDTDKSGVFHWGIRCGLNVSF